MRHLNGVYTQRYNATHGKGGHLFQGRYNALLVGRPSLARIPGNIRPKDRQARSRAMVRAYLEHGYRMNEIADSLGVHYATVSRAVRDHEEEMS